jgi:hypothetical protein
MLVRAVLLFLSCPLQLAVPNGNATENANLNACDAGYAGPLSRAEVLSVSQTDPSTSEYQEVLLHPKMPEPTKITNRSHPLSRLHMTRQARCRQPIARGSFGG